MPAPACGGAAGLSGSVGSIDVVLTAPRDQAEVASVRVDYLVVRAFAHPNKNDEQASPWRQLSVIGHRGSGAERNAHVPGSGYRTHVRENTVLSFNVAAASGTECVEFGAGRAPPTPARHAA